MKLLDVKDLRVEFKTPDGNVVAVNDLNFSSLRAKPWGSSASPVRASPRPRSPSWGCWPRTVSSPVRPNFRATDPEPAGA